MQPTRKSPLVVHNSSQGMLPITWKSSERA
jgi:hypothetical protein